MCFPLLLPPRKREISWKLSYCKFPCKSKFFTMELIYCFKSFTYITETCCDLSFEIFKCIFFSYKGAQRDMSHDSLHYFVCIHWQVQYRSKLYCFLDLHIFQQTKTSTLYPCLAISFGYDFIIKTNNASISPCTSSAIYPKMVCKIFVPYSCIFQSQL